MTLIEAVRPYKIILASKSPRRIQFLKDLEIPFEIALIDVKEIYDFSLKKEEITNYLCKLKADAYEFRQDNEIIITCDTIVWANDKARSEERRVGKECECAYAVENSNSKEDDTPV